MRRAALVVAIAAGCGGGCGAPQPPPDDGLAGIEDELPGTCIDPRTALASTVVDIRSIDRDAVIVCAGTTVCRKIELATGAMVEPSPSQVGPVVAPVHAAVDGLALAAGETLEVAAKAPTGEVVALVGSGGKHEIALWRADATPAGRFAPTIAGQVRDVAWLGGTIYATIADATAVRGMLYETDGTEIGVVGGDDAPFDVRRAQPMQVGRSQWAWLDADAGMVALHDMVRHTRARIVLGASGVDVGLSDARATPDGRVVIAYGGQRFGDLLVIETGDAVMKSIKARRCPE